MVTPRQAFFAFAAAGPVLVAVGSIIWAPAGWLVVPVGVATQDPRRSQALVVSNKADRVANFHAQTTRNFLELVGPSGCEHPSELGLEHIARRIDQTSIATYDQIFGLPVQRLQEASR